MYIVGYNYLIFLKILMVRCPSGLRSTPGKRIYVNTYQGFESLSHRIIQNINIKNI